MSIRTFGSSEAPTFKFSSKDTEPSLKKTVLLVFPDSVQLAGFRAALRILNTQSPTTPTIAHWTTKPDICVSTSSLAQYRLSGPTSECTALFFTPQETNELIQVCNQFVIVITPLQYTMYNIASFAQNILLIVGISMPTD